MEYAQKRKTIQIAGKIMGQAKEKDITKTLSEAIADLMAIEQEQTDDDTGEIKDSLVQLFLDC